MEIDRPLLFALAVCVASCRPAHPPITTAQSAGSTTHAATRVDRDAAVLLARADAASHSVDEIAQWPTMPAQSAPWRAANESSFSQSVRWLFDHGMPDPRELEYVRARVTVGDLWGGRASSVEADGWLYRAPDDAQWFLGWNGNLYEPEAVLGPADFDADYAQLTATPDGGNAMMYRFVRARGGEAGALVPSIAEPITNAILARLGRRGSSAVAAQEEPFATLVADYQWALFDRAVCAHMRGDDATTLRVATRLVSLRDAAQRELAQALDAAAPEPNQGDPFAFALAAESLRADARRRLARGPRAPSVVARDDRDAGVGPSGPAASAQAAEQPMNARSIEARVRAIIDELDEVDARQWGQPGGVNLAGDPRVNALIELGEPAIPRLIDALERDERLTRSVHFWRDFSRHRSVLGVHEAAYTAIANILRQDFFRVASTGDDLSGRGPAGRAQLAARVREYWNRMSAIPLHERASRVLADNRAPPEQWATAADNIVTRSVTNAQPGPMLGEPLRSRRNPSVTERFAQRAEQLLAASADPEADGAYERRRSADTITRALIEWEPRAPALRTLTARWMPRSTVDETAAYCTAALLAARAEAGDEAAVGEYARWLPTLSYDVVRMSPSGLLELTRRRPNDPHIQTAVRALLGPRGWIGDGRDPRRVVSVLEAMLHLDPARQYAAQRLADRTVIGELEVNGTNYGIHYRSGGSLSASGSVAGRNGRYPWRMCDELALNLRTYSDADNARAAQLLGPVAARDAAIASRAAELRQPAPPTTRAP